MILVVDDHAVLGQGIRLMLEQAGFRHVRSVSFDEICLTMTGTYAREREFRFQRIVRASVSPPAGSCLSLL